MKLPLLKQIATIMLLFISILSYSQRLQNEKFELFLTELIVNETEFDSSMKMSDNKQYFYEGEISVTSKDCGIDSKYGFFFSVWDGQCKSFLVKDTKSNIIEPRVFFKNKTAFIKKDEKIKASIDLKGISQVEKYILTCMLFWLNQKEMKNGTIVAK